MTDYWYQRSTFNDTSSSSALCSGRLTKGWMTHSGFKHYFKMWWAISMSLQILENAYLHLNFPLCSMIPQGFGEEKNICLFLMHLQFVASILSALDQNQNLKWNTLEPQWKFETQISQGQLLHQNLAGVISLQNVQAMIFKPMLL